MKKILVVALFVFMAVGACFAQAKKPALMVVPSDVWCNQNGYMDSFDNQGHTEQYPNYEKALQNNLDLTLAISKLGEMMTERGFPLKDLAACLKTVRQESAEESVTTSKDGEGLAETPLEKLSRVAKADIIIQLTWKMNVQGPKKSVTFNIQGLDAYTNKQIAAASGTGSPSFSVETPVLLEESILSYIDQFNSQLQGHFDDLFANGREVSLSCRRWSGSETDFETDFNGNELGFIIEDWVAANTVQGRFSTADASANRMVFEQVRIPLNSPVNGRAMDTRTWANGLKKDLKDNYGIDSKLTTKGLGQAIITIGGK